MTDVREQVRPVKVGKWANFSALLSPEAWPPGMHTGAGFVCAGSGLPQDLVPWPLFECVSVGDAVWVKMMPGSLAEGCVD